MPRAQSTRTKPKKPREDFPLTASPNGHWVKKIKGKVYNFGRWENPDAALKRYVAERDYIQAHGCRPIDDGGIRLDHAIKAFLDRQKARLNHEIGTPISERHFDDQKAICLVLLNTFSKSRSVTTLRPADFVKLYPAISRTKERKRAESSTIARNIANVKAVFNWLAKEGLIPNRLNFGADFKAPPKTTAQDVAESETDSQFSPEETWAMIDAAPVNTRAMIWLALNTASNNACCANVTQKAIDLGAGVMTWKRWKVRNKAHAKVRTIPLWNETIQALREAAIQRPEPLEESNADLFFLTRSGRQWSQWSLSQEITKLKNKLGIEKKGVGFNSFRHVIETFGGVDQVAIDWVMGHIDSKVAKHYRDSVPRERIEAVLANVRVWLGEKPE